MPVIGAPIGTYFTLRLYKRLSTNPALMWANNYEFTNLAAPVSASDIDIAIDKFAALEQSMALTDVMFDRGVFSTWVEDGEPYDPTSFVTKPLTLLGLRGISGDALSLNHCLFVRRATTFGQNGKLFYRRSLLESDMASSSGTPSLNGTGTLTALAAGIAAGGIDEYMDGETQNLQLRMKSTLLVDRPITGLAVAGIRIMQFNNRYFDVP